MNNIKIICDSLSDVNKILRTLWYRCSSLTLILDGKEYRDSIDISPEDLQDFKRRNAYPKLLNTYAQFKEVLRNT